MTITIKSKRIARMLYSLAGADTTPDQQAENILINAFLLWNAGKMAGLEEARSSFE